MFLSFKQSYVKILKVEKPGFFPSSSGIIGLRPCASYPLKDEEEWRPDEEESIVKFSATFVKQLFLIRENVISPTAVLTNVVLPPKICLMTVLIMDVSPM